MNTTHKTIQKILLLFFILISISNGYGQFIEGQLYGLKNKEIKLEGFNGVESYLISKTNTNEVGAFKLSYLPKDTGVAYLTSQGSQPYFILLNGENISIIGESLVATTSIKITKGSQNIAFVKYNQEQAKRDQLLSAWKFLKKNYSEDIELKKDSKTNQDITNEINKLNKKEQDFLNTLPENSYIKWLLPIRKTIINFPFMIKYYPEELPIIFEQIKKINYTDNRLFKSGLYKESIDIRLKAIEYIFTPEKVNREANNFIDALLLQVTNDEIKYNQVVELLFKILNDHSFYDSIDYLTNKVENNTSCSRSDGVVSQLEKYKKLAIGSKLSDIEFSQDAIFPNRTAVKKMSELKNTYTLVIFAASWCPHCTESIPKIAQLYPDLKAKGVDVVLVSLDENLEKFRQFTSSLPFVSTTDYKKWNSQAAKDYNINGTPSYFILDQNLSLVVRPRDLQHIKTWLKEK